MKPAINEIKLEEEKSQTESGSDENEELCILKTRENKFRGRSDANKKGEPQSKSENRKSNIVCFNCKKAGHIFSECKITPTRIFCYRCGKEDNKATTCSNCLASKNGANALLSNEQSNSENEETE